VRITADNNKHMAEERQPLLSAEPDEPPNKVRERRQSKRTRKQGRECAAICLAVCCFHREGPHSSRVHNGVAALQNYSDFAILEELPIIKSLKNIVNETCNFNNNASHEQLLDSLRQKLKPVSSAEDFDWRELGFQSRNCRTDFRGCGLEGLRCLHYLADNYPSDYESYINHSNIEGQTEGRISYPFSASALAIVMVLVNRLCLAESPPIMSPDCGTAIQKPSLTDRDELRTFLQLIVQAPIANRPLVFREIFCAAVAAMHNAWISKPRKDIDIMYFNKLTYLPAWEAVCAVLKSSAAIDEQQSLSEICRKIRVMSNSSANRANVSHR